jgi:hypothetical protein
MRWIKATERLPEEWKDVPLKLGSNYEVGHYSPIDNFEYFQFVNGWSERDFSKIEWLDETPDTCVHSFTEFDMKKAYDQGFEDADYWNTREPNFGKFMKEQYNINIP